MNKKRFTIVSHLTSEKTVHLPIQFKQQIEIHSVALGSHLVDGFTISYHQHSHKILLSADIYSDLLIPYESKADVVIVDQALYIGPLIGIFTAGFE
ncbi:hypothetical protein WAX46_08605 [Bacillus sp. FJAT-53060]